MPEFAMLLRLTKARSGAWVCDPQRVEMFGYWKLLLATAIIFALIGNTIAADRGPSVKPGDAKHTAELQEVELRGRVVCLPEAMHDLYHTDLPANHEHVYGFKAGDGT